MIHGLALKHRPDPDPTGALVYFSLIAATGFAFGWAVQALGAF
jgi:hypothetical protein